MTYKDILEENENYRVYLVPDYDADKPYDCGQPPIVLIERSPYGHNRYVQHVDTGDRPHNHDSDVENAIEHWNVRPYDDGWEFFQKYMRAYFGTTKIDTYQTQDGNWYIAYDTEEWIRSIGFDDVTAPRANYDTLPDHDFLVEVRAWIEGDVYGYVVERKVTGQKVYDDERDDEPFAQWEQVDSCWGFYGYEYAKEAALEAYNLETKES